MLRWVRVSVGVDKARRRGIETMEWQPPHEDPEPGGPSEMPPADPEQPSPPPAEMPEPPNETPTPSPREARAEGRRGAE